MKFIQAKVSSAFVYVYVENKVENEQKRQKVFREESRKRSFLGFFVPLEFFSTSFSIQETLQPIKLFSLALTSWK